MLQGDLCLAAPCRCQKKQSQHTPVLWPPVPELLPSAAPDPLIGLAPLSLCLPLLLPQLRAQGALASSQATRQAHHSEADLGCLLDATATSKAANWLQPIPKKAARWLRAGEQEDEVPPPATSGSPVKEAHALIHELLMDFMHAETRKKQESAAFAEVQGRTRGLRP